MDPPANFDWNLWLGQAPKVDYTETRAHYQFRWWFEYSGGQVTDWGVHHSDIAVWALGGDETGPVEAEGTGQFPQGREKTAAMLLKGEKPANGYNVATTFDANIGLANGNTIICNWAGHGYVGKQPQLVEITPDKKVVGVLFDYTRFGTLSGFFVIEPK